ncbi:MAG: HDOD domain-containing protein [Bacteroidetes bacterium]|nr:HDOD domain-containing protein [Rhodothermia bacterium]MCS7154388.1 HDOD domain-containing protein [Bacteroidota bacterium]MCX7907633.1 HDOD domain-containing protein [Bacteroidota bacterium]MDW8137762.1 HDOD domain-containing protein [Bacteroidota bacterium]MDW8286387.1 HDOD domain-containing protein [Bacteroidota bacterium]
MQPSREQPPAVRLSKPLSFDLELPPLPATVAQVSEILAAGAQQADFARLTQIIERDVATSVAVLRRVNSAYYGLRVRVSDIGRAVRLLGLVEVSNIVTTISMLRLRNLMRTEEQVRIYRQLLTYSLGTAFFAQFLADSLKLAAKALAFTGGLLHNVGALVLLYNEPELYEAIWYGAADGRVPSVEEERAILGIDHVQVGAHAVREWHFAEELEWLITYQGDPEALPHSLKPLGYALAVGKWVGYALPLTPHLDWQALAEKRAFRNLCASADAEPKQVLVLLQHQLARGKEFLHTAVEA